MREQRQTVWAGVIMRDEDGGNPALTYLSALGVSGSGRKIVLCSAEHCAACDTLFAALQTWTPPHLDAVVVSKVKVGEVGVRTAHLRMGARRYPTVLLVEDCHIVGRLEGLIEDAEGVVLSHYLSFLDEGRLPPELER